MEYLWTHIRHMGQMKEPGRRLRDNDIFMSLLGESLATAPRFIKLPPKAAPLSSSASRPQTSDSKRNDALSVLPDYEIICPMPMRRLSIYLSALSHARPVQQKSTTHHLHFRRVYAVLAAERFQIVMNTRLHLFYFFF